MPAQNHHISNRFDGYDVLEEIPPFRLVKIVVENGKLGFRLCGAAETPCAVNGPKPAKLGSKFNPDDHTMYNLRECAEWKVVFATDAALGAKIYTAAGGMVTKTPVAGATYLGIASKAVAAPRGTGDTAVYDVVPVIQDVASGTLYAAPPSGG